VYYLVALLAIISGFQKNHVLEQITHFLTADFCLCHTKNRNFRTTTQSIPKRITTEQHHVWVGEEKKTLAEATMGGAMAAMVPALVAVATATTGGRRNPHRCCRPPRQRRTPAATPATVAAAAAAAGGGWVNLMNLS
jgi:hypothetical protein